jgi:hypothetical protein
MLCSAWLVSTAFISVIQLNRCAPENVAIQNRKYDVIWRVVTVVSDSASHMHLNAVVFGWRIVMLYRLQYIYRLCAAHTHTHTHTRARARGTSFPIVMYLNTTSEINCIYSRFCLTVSWWFYLFFCFVFYCPVNLLQWIWIYKTDKNLVREGNKFRLQLGPTACHFSFLLSKNVDTEMHETEVLRVVWYECDTWSSTLTETWGWVVFKKQGGQQNFVLKEGGNNEMVFVVCAFHEIL